MATMDTLHLRTMETGDRAAVAELICVSTNFWYQRRGNPAIFPAGPESTELFFDVYEALDPGCGLVAVNPRNGQLMGSCFMHPRQRHMSLGIMNVHPNYAGRGVASRLLRAIIERADQMGLPAVRLVQSALNLDSFSLYNRAGFVPRYSYQDMLLRVPEAGFLHRTPDADRVRPATAADVPAMVALEDELAGIGREQDWRYFLENRDGIWSTLVYEGPGGRLEGFLASSRHPAMNMLGPGVTRTAGQAAALIAATAPRYRGGAAVALVPMVYDELVQTMYGWGATNCELHFCQVRGAFRPFTGVTLPTFLPESA